MTSAITPATPGGAALTTLTAPEALQTAPEAALGRVAQVPGGTYKGYIPGFEHRLLEQDESPQAPEVAEHPEGVEQGHTEAPAVATPAEAAVAPPEASKKPTLKLDHVKPEPSSSAEPSSSKTNEKSSELPSLESMNKALDALYDKSQPQVDKSQKVKPQKVDRPQKVKPQKVDKPQKVEKSFDEEMGKFLDCLEQEGDGDEAPKEGKRDQYKSLLGPFSEALQQRLKRMAYRKRRLSYNFAKKLLR